MEIKETHELSEVPPPSFSWDQTLSSRHLPVHCPCNEIVAKDVVWLKPHVDPGVRGKAIDKKQAHHPVHLQQIEWLEVFVDGSAKARSLCRCLCSGRVDHALLYKLGRDLCVKEVLWLTVSDRIGQEFQCGRRNMSSFGCS
jgi:hypothetical protein